MRFSCDHVLFAPTFLYIYSMLVPQLIRAGCQTEWSNGVLSDTCRLLISITGIRNAQNHFFGNLCVCVCVCELSVSPLSHSELLEKPTGYQLVNIFPAIYGTRRFITALTSACHLSLFWARSIQSIPPHSTLIFSHLHLCLPSGLFPSDFPTKTLYTSLYTCIYLVYVLHAPPISLIVRSVDDSKRLIWSRVVKERQLCHSHRQ